MPDEKLLKEQLKKTLDASTTKYLPNEKLEEAANEIIKKGTADKPLLESIGKEVFGDDQIFQRTNIDDIITILDQIKGK